MTVCLPHNINLLFLGSIQTNIIPKPLYSRTHIMTGRLIACIIYTVAFKTRILIGIAISVYN